ncbi:MAG: hypothetical protein EOO36_20025 [Cytophagaceae bacterium]|nr:MAG: hypothetical protein EOO36_20025 [Cytophagaceae bacterium]
MRELERLPLTDQLFVIERTLKSIRTDKERRLKAAVDSLYEDYKSDPELTAFTQLVGEIQYLVG